MTTGDWIQAGAAVVAAVSLVWAVQQFRREWRRLEDARQEAAFDVVNSHYFDFLALCMQHPELELSDLGGELKRTLPADPDLQVRNQVMYEYFFQLLEKVFVLYRVGDTWKETVSGPAKSSGVGDFLQRQWLGWDKWISDYCERPAIRKQFNALDNGTTYDRQFMEYMKHRMAQAEGSG